MKKRNDLVWNVFRRNMNTKNIEVWNVFKHSSFYNAIMDSFKKHKDNKEDFISSLKSDLMYYYWAKSEWEVGITPPFSNKDEAELKVDVFVQVFNNWHIFSEYTWHKLSENKGKKNKPTEK